MGLEENLTKELLDTVAIARLHNYYPKEFENMLVKHGGLKTVQTLLSKKESQSGLIRLYNLGLLNISMEAKVLEGRFDGLFIEEEIGEARSRLEGLGYFGYSSNHHEISSGSVKFEPHSASRFHKTLRDFVDHETWTYAKTIPDWPHEYIVRKRVDEQLFMHLVIHIRAKGYEGDFYRKKMIYFDEAGLVYWTMGASLEETTIVNRCTDENTYAHRLAEGTLPNNRQN